MVVVGGDYDGSGGSGSGCNDRGGSSVTATSPSARQGERRTHIPNMIRGCSLSPHSLSL